MFELAQGLRDWTFPEKIQNGRKGEDIEFPPEVFKKWHAEFPGVNLKKVEFISETKKNSCEISRGLGFLAF